MTAINTDRSLIEEEINSHIDEFELLALLRLLKYHGYNEPKVFYFSNYNMASQSSLIHQVNLFDDRADVHINIGILSPQSPLPGYFFKKIDEHETIDNDSFKQFLNFFDHLLIRDYLCNIYPEINENYFDCWESRKKQYTHLHNFRSIQSLYWLFQLVYPELTILIEKRSFSEKKKTPGLALGSIMLGDESSMGGMAAVPVNGIYILLRYDCDYWVDLQQFPVDIKMRLHDLIFPVLARLNIFLDINLDIFISEKWLKLNNRSNLGYDNFYGGSKRNRRVKIYKGYVPLIQFKKMQDYTLINSDSSICRMNI